MTVNARNSTPRTLHPSYLGRKNEREKLDPKKVKTVVHSAVSQYFACARGEVGTFASLVKHALNPFNKLYKGECSCIHLQDKKPRTAPIFLIHGHHGKAIQFQKLTEQLISHGYKGKIYTINIPNNGRLPVAEEAAKVASIIQKTLGSSKTKQVHLVGHSKGGIVASHIKENLSGPTSFTVKKVVTIASPFFGSKVAGLAAATINPQLKDLAYGNQDLKALRAKMKSKPDGYYFIANEQDYAINPAGKKSIPLFARTEERHFILNEKTVGHVAILNHVEVSRRIHTWITTP